LLARLRVRQVLQKKSFCVICVFCGLLKKA